MPPFGPPCRTHGTASLGVTATAAGDTYNNNLKLALEQMWGNLNVVNGATYFPQIVNINGRQQQPTADNLKNNCGAIVVSGHELKCRENRFEGRLVCAVVSLPLCKNPNLEVLSCTQPSAPCLCP